MRRALLITLFLANLPLRAEAPALLDQAIRKLMADVDHWAYTETTQKFGSSGKPEGGPTVERFDPSKPAEQEWQLIRYQGHAPSDSELRYWKRQKESEMKHRGEKSLGDVLDLDHAVLASQTDATATFRVPILKDASKRFPADKLEVFMNVDKRLGALTSFALKPKAPFRIAGVVRVESGDLEGRLDVVKDNTTPALVWWKGSGKLRVLGIIPIGIGREASYAEFKRVTPFNDRFEVKIGDIKALNF
jgi:hypothetical protein